MKHKVSELMDGELDADEATELIIGLKGRVDLQNNWKTYHLIGDTLRYSSKLSVDVSQNVSKQLETEPAIVAPSAPKYLPKRFRRKMVGLSVAASIVILVTGWLSMHALQQPQQTLVVENANVDKIVPPIHVINSASSSIYAEPYESEEINDYLYVHGEFSPGTVASGLILRDVHSVTVSPD